MPHDIPKDEIEKLRESQDPEGSKKKTTEKSERMTKANALDLTKADSHSTGIIDIVDNPDVAVWSKGIMKKTSTPADKVQEPHHIKSMTAHIEYREWEEKQSHLQQQTVDPANKEDVAKAIDLETSLTDKSTGFVPRSKKATSSEG
ncbi:MAG: hypothetical protein ACJ70M_08045 [Nitrososphaera sp.]